MAVTYKDWLKMLPFSLHEYCTSVHILAGATPPSFSVYNMEAMLPVEVEVSSIGVLLKSKLEFKCMTTLYDYMKFV